MGVNEHFELIFNAVMDLRCRAASGVFKQLLMARAKTTSYVLRGATRLRPMQVAGSRLSRIKGTRSRLPVNIL
jgi:sigma54-dependent transcription regulator